MIEHEEPSDDDFTFEPYVEYKPENESEEGSDVTDSSNISTPPTLNEVLGQLHEIGALDNPTSPIMRLKIACGGRPLSSPSGRNKLEKHVLETFLELVSTFSNGTDEKALTSLSADLFDEDSQSVIVDRLPAPSALEEGVIDSGLCSDFFYMGSIPHPTEDQWQAIIECCTQHIYHRTLLASAWLGVFLNPTIFPEQIALMLQEHPSTEEWLRRDFALTESNNREASARLISQHLDNALQTMGDSK